MSTTATTDTTASSSKLPTYYKQASKRGQGPWDVIVIGSGMGGMACAAALAKHGRRVLVLEQHYVPGGFTHVFSRKGYTFDVGVHCLGQMSHRDVPGRLVNWLSDGKVKMNSMGGVYETFHFPGDFSIEFPDSREEFRKNLYSKFPNEKEAIDKYFDLVRVVNASSKPYFASKTLPRWADVVTRRLLKNKIHWWGLTTKEVLDGITQNEKLKAVLTANWGYYGSTPSESSFGIHALVTRHFWNGGYYPEGGSQKIAEGFLETVRKAGGETLVRATVQEILIKNGKAVGVRVKDASNPEPYEIFAPIIVSAVGAKATVERLLPEEYKRQDWSQSIASLQQSPPHVCLYIGFEGDITKAGATVSNQWFMETWDMEHKWWKVSDPKSEAPVLYMSFPSLKDPHHDPGPNMRHTGEVVTFVPWEDFEKWKHTRRGFRDSEYQAFKKGIEDRMIAQLRKHIPQLMDMVKYHELSTPLSTVHFTAAPHGAIYGLEASPARFTSPHIRTRTPVKNLYMAGGDIATLGVTGALMGGILCASTIDRKVFKRLM